MIKVKTSAVNASNPIELKLIDRSGAHVILTVSIEGQPPISHAFDFNEGELSAPVKLKKGSYACTFTIQSFKHGALNGMYDSALAINGQRAASAQGNIPSGRTNDVGFGDFTLVVA
jgi:hypothetical protein